MSLFDPGVQASQKVCVVLIHTCMYICGLHGLESVQARILSLGLIISTAGAILFKIRIVVQLPYLLVVP